MVFLKPFFFIIVSVVLFKSHGYTMEKSFQSHSEILKASSFEKVDQKIVGGLPANQGDFPYQLSLRRNGFHFCGGSLIRVAGELIALTAAHCVAYLNGITSGLAIVAGDVRISDTTGHEQAREVRKIIIHESYGNNNSLKGLYNDIALIFLNKPYELNEFVAVISLPLANQETFGNLTISGWGTLNSGGEVSDTLQYVEMPIVSHSICHEKWKHHPKYPMEIGGGILCSGVESGNLSACHGDSGGPAVSRDNDILMGIFSFGDPICGHPEYPGGFTNVAYYIRWMKEQVEKFISMSDDKLPHRF